MSFKEIIYSIVDAYQGIAKCDRLDDGANDDGGELRLYHLHRTTGSLGFVDEFAEITFVYGSGNAEGGHEPGAVPNPVPLPA